MTTWTSRALADHAEFPLLRDILTRAWVRRGPLDFSTPGPLDWWRAANPSADLTRQIALWARTDNEPEAWTWSRSGGLEWFIEPELDPNEEWELRSAMLAAHVEQARTEAAAECTVFAVEGTVEEAVARESGLSSRPGNALLQLRADLAQPAVPALPPGYRIRPVQLPEELDARVAVHRAAFDPSRYTAEKQTALAEPGSAYDPSLDLVVEAPDGALVGFAIGWVDRDACVAEIEPLGVHPDHARRGIATAIASTLLALFAERGARTAIVHAADGNPAATAAYTRAGFTGRGRRAMMYAAPLEARNERGPG